MVYNKRSTAIMFIISCRRIEDVWSQLLKRVNCNPKKTERSKSHPKQNPDRMGGGVSDKVITHSQRGFHWMNIYR